MSPWLESVGQAPEHPERRLSLAEAAARLGCHVETLRLRVRQGRLWVTRGPHGRYYVTEEELSFLLPPRRVKRRDLAPALPPELVAEDIDALLGRRGSLAAWHRSLLEDLRRDPAADRHLFRALAVQALLLRRVNTVETATLLGLSVRQVRRLRQQTLVAALASARRRRTRVERGQLRKAAKPIVAQIQQRLVAAGFVAARRDPRSETSGAQRGRVARVALVRYLNPNQVRDLQLAGLNRQQIASIILIGIGADELNELILNGLASAVMGHPIP